MSAVKVKNHNDKIYKNKNGNPQKRLRAIEVEGTLWTEAQLSVKKDLPMASRLSIGNLWDRPESVM